MENLDGNDLGLLITDGVMLAIMIAIGFAIIVRALSPHHSLRSRDG